MKLEKTKHRWKSLAILLLRRSQGSTVGQANKSLLSIFNESRASRSNFLIEFRLLIEISSARHKKLDYDLSVPIQIDFMELRCA
jgi:hypothetical protein